MSEHISKQTPMNTWESSQCTERFAVRVRVCSAVSTLPQSIGPENVKEAYHLSDQRMETLDKPEITEYAVDGEVAVFSDHVIIRYPEPAMTGLGNCETRIRYWPERPALLELNRTGASAVHCLFDLGAPRQSVTFQTMFGSFEPIMTLKELINLLDYGIGRLHLHYTVDFPNIFSERIELRIDVRRLRTSESRPISSAPHPNEAYLHRLSGDMEKMSSFDYSPDKDEKDGETQ